jgi:hypothetical protein
MERDPGEMRFTIIALGPNDEVWTLLNLLHENYWQNNWKENLIVILLDNVVDFYYFDRHQCHHYHISLTGSRNICDSNSTNCLH